MEPLHINATKYTPEIDFNPETFHLQIVGDSRPEDTVGFYQKILQWIDAFVAWMAQQNTQQAVLLTFQLNYFNSISIFKIDLITKIYEQYMAIYTMGIAYKTCKSYRTLSGVCGRHG